MKWKKLDQGGVLPVERSSHVVTVVGDKLYLWGGEHEPREPLDSQIHGYDLGGSSSWAQPEVRFWPCACASVQAQHKTQQRMKAPINLLHNSPHPFIFFHR